MLIKRKSPVTGRTQAMEIAVTDQQNKEWENGALIQEVMSHLSPDEREFIISGCTPEDFTFLFPEE